MISNYDDLVLNMTWDDAHGVPNGDHPSINYRKDQVLIEVQSGEAYHG